MFLIVLLSGRPVYDPNPLRPNPNLEKPVSGSCRVRGLGRTLTPLVVSRGSLQWVGHGVEKTRREENAREEHKKRERTGVDPRRELC